MYTNDKQFLSHTSKGESLRIILKTSLSALLLITCGCAVVSDPPAPQTTGTSHHSEPDSHHEEHASHTGKCGHTLTFVSAKTGEKTGHEENCTHHVYGTDVIETCEKDETWHCDICGKDEIISTELTDTICHGYDF